MTIEKTCSDPQETVVGVFVPQRSAELEQLKSLFNWDEVKRIAATERTARQLADILNDLEKGALV